MRQCITQFQGTRHQGVYRLIATPIFPCSISTGAFGAFKDANTDESHDRSLTPKMTSLWHESIGHAYTGSIKKRLSTWAFKGIVEAKERKQPCECCTKGQQTKQTLRTNTHRSRVRCAVVHSDVCGPMSVSSFSGCRYFVSFIDEYTGYIVIIPILRKSEVLAQFKRYHAWLERKFDCTPTKIHSDNGGEYVALKSYLEEKVIEQSMTPPYSPNLNGMSERANRTIMESARAMLEHSSLPRTFWAEAVIHAARIQNMFFCPRDKTITSYELMTGNKPDVSYLRVFV